MPLGRTQDEDPAMQPDQLCKGRIFKRDGASYIVTEQRAMSQDCLKVRRIDGSRQLMDMPVNDVIRCLGREVALD
jgi:hypothetical protein